jgi:hypothetical protein
VSREHSSKEQPGSSDSSPLRGQEKVHQGVADRLQGILLSIGSRIIGLASKRSPSVLNADGEPGSARGERTEVLDVLDRVLAWLPKKLRERLTSSPEATRLFESLEGKGSADAGSVQQQIEQLRHQQKRLMYGEGVGRNDPCPCGCGKKAKKCETGRKMIR